MAKIEVQPGLSSFWLTCTSAILGCSDVNEEAGESGLPVAVCAPRVARSSTIDGALEVARGQLDNERWSRNAEMVSAIKFLHIDVEVRR